MSKKRVVCPFRVGDIVEYNNRKYCITFLETWKTTYSMSLLKLNSEARDVEELKNFLGGRAINHRNAEGFPMKKSSILGYSSMLGLFQSKNWDREQPVTGDLVLFMDKLFTVTSTYLYAVTYSGAFDIDGTVRVDDEYNSRRYLESVRVMGDDLEE